MGLNYRFLRRLIIRNFGSCKNFWLWVLATIVIIYLLDLVIFSAQRDKRVWDGGYLQGGNITGPPGSRMKPVPGTKCGVTCPENQYAFYIKTGYQNKVGPIICFEDQIAISPSLNDIQRGINMVVIDEHTKLVKDVIVFDTYSDDTPLIRYIRTQLADNDIVMMASFDEIANNLRDSKVLLKQLGSSLIDRLKYRDSYMMVGQKNLKSGYAVEYHKRATNKGFGITIEKTGCFSLPMGDLSNKILGLQNSLIMEDKIKLGPTHPDCGMTDPCSGHSIPVLVYTGQGNTEWPKVCVTGQYVVAKDLNNGGRGFNVVIVDPVRRKVNRMARFDTYEEDSSAFEIFLEAIKPGELVIAVTADESSKKLSNRAKDLLQSLGSSLVESLRFRDVWYFIGQKGINGFTLMEQISYAGPDGQWPKPLMHSFCIPTNIKGTMILPDPQVWRNDERRAFCKKYDGYIDFCDPSHVDDLLKPVPLVDKGLEGNIAYDTPIIIVPGINHNSLVKTLETALMQSGMNAANVHVFYDERVPEYANLAALFGFHSIAMPGFSSYQELLFASIEKIWSLHPDKKYVIVIEEELLLGPDFLAFLAQCVITMDKDDTLLGISAWNPNGYEVSSYNVSSVYRVAELPGLAFMLKREAFEQFFRGNYTTCCSQRSWVGWRLPEGMNHEIMIPDVSRVYRQPNQGASDEVWTELFHRPRLTNLYQKTVLRDIEKLALASYDEKLEELVRGSLSLNKTSLVLVGCQQDRNGLARVNSIYAQKILSVFYEQHGMDDYKTLWLLCRCFGLFTAKSHPPRGVHKGVLRFSSSGNELFLISSESPFYKWKPHHTQTITSSDFNS